MSTFHDEKPPTAPVAPISSRGRRPPSRDHTSQNKSRNQALRPRVPYARKFWASTLSGAIDQNRAHAACALGAQKPTPSPARLRERQNEHRDIAKTIKA